MSHNDLFFSEVEIIAIYISPAHNFVGHHGQEPDKHPTIALTQAECVAGEGIRRDRYFAHKKDYKGQITFFEWEVYEELRHVCDVQDLSPSAFRRNVITHGMHLNDWIGKRFSMQGIVFEGTQECSPCYWMNTAFHPKAEDALRGRGGLRAKILTSGILQPGPAQLADLSDSKT